MVDGGPNGDGEVSVFFWPGRTNLDVLQIQKTGRAGPLLGPLQHDDRRRQRLWIVLSATRSMTGSRKAMFSALLTLNRLACIWNLVLDGRVVCRARHEIVPAACARGSGGTRAKDKERGQSQRSKRQPGTECPRQAGS